MEIKEIDITNNLYPIRLKEIKNPPKKLYVLGDEKLLNKESLSIVGSRNCTENGKKMSRNFAKGIAQRGIVIVSGMARGIDSEAHLGAIEAMREDSSSLGFRL